MWNMGTTSSSVTFKTWGLVARLPRVVSPWKTVMPPAAYPWQRADRPCPSAGAGPAVFRNNYYQNTLPADSLRFKDLGRAAEPGVSRCLNAGQEPGSGTSPAPYGLNNQACPLPWHLRFLAWDRAAGRRRFASAGYTPHRAAAVPPTPHHLISPLEQLACLCTRINTDNTAYRAKSFPAAK